jgi:hypothetical protein
VEADFFADCSGDSILAPLTGAHYREGREGKNDFGEPTYVESPDKLHMGMSCLIQGRETTRSVAFTPPPFALKLSQDDFRHRSPRMHSSYENFWYLELGGNRDAIGDTEEVAKDLRALAMGTWDYVKNSGNYDADTWELEFFGFLPGKRESRRMVGEYTVTANDLLENTRFPDTVAYGGWPIDDHYPDGFYHKGHPNTNILPDAPYSIPYRALYSANVSNLFFAGRNISMTHMAMSTMRVMATCALMGQAVGTAAALCTRYGEAPHGIYLHHLTELQENIQAADGFIPAKLRPVGDLCRSTPILDADGQPLPNEDALKDGRDRPHASLGTETCGLSIPNSQPLEYRFSEPQAVESVHLTFNSDLNRDTLPGVHVERTRSMRANTRLDSPVMHMPLTLCRTFRLEADTADGTEVLLDVTDNPRRAYHLTLNRRDIIALRLILLENWGGTNQTDLFSFDFR